MGKLTAAGAELANRVVTGVLDAVEVGTTFAVETHGGRRSSSKFNVAVWGTFAATAKLQKSFDGGTTWFDTGTEFTAVGTAQVEEPEEGVLYRLNMTAWTSGAANYRISQ